MSQKDKLISLIAQLQSDIAKYQQQLAELDKPKLRNLDYGFFEERDFRLFVRVDGKFRALDEEGYCANHNVLQGLAWKRGNYKIKGNLKEFTDDLQRNAVDLKEFKVEAAGVRNGFIAETNSPESCAPVRLGLIYNHGAKDTWNFTIDQATEIHQKLGQVIATARRRQNVS